MQEYKRLETLRQIKEADRRTEEMTTRKEEMVAQRRKAATEVCMSRMKKVQTRTQTRRHANTRTTLASKACGGQDRLN